MKISLSSLLILSPVVALVLCAAAAYFAASHFEYRWQAEVRNAYTDEVFFVATHVDPTCEQPIPAGIYVIEEKPVGQFDVLVNKLISKKKGFTPGNEFKVGLAFAPGRIWAGPYTTDINRTTTKFFHRAAFEFGFKYIQSEILIRPQMASRRRR